MVKPIVLEIEDEPVRISHDGGTVTVDTRSGRFSADVCKQAPDSDIELEQMLADAMWGIVEYNNYPTYEKWLAYTGMKDSFRSRAEFCRDKRMAMDWERVGCDLDPEAIVDFIEDRIDGGSSD